MTASANCVRLPLRQPHPRTPAASRKKFSQLARLFHFNRRGARHMLGPGTASAGDQLLLGDDQLTEDDLSQECPPPAPPFVSDRRRRRPS